MNAPMPGLPEAPPPPAKRRASRRGILVLAILVAAALGVCAIFFVPGQRSSVPKPAPAPAAAAPDESWLSAKDFATSNSVSLVLGEQESGNGLEHIPTERDGLTIVETVNGMRCRRLNLPALDSRGERRTEGYVYFFIDPTFKQGDSNRVRIEVEYYNEKKGSLALQYDARANPKTSQSKYTFAGHWLALDGAKEWETAIFHVRDGAFESSENGGADFRLLVRPPELWVRRVTITRETDEADL